VSRPLVRSLKFGLALLLLLAVLAATAGFIDASRFREPLRAALEAELGRPVEFGALHYAGFPAPGLSASDVVIHELPQFGLEPLAYVTTMQIGPRWLALLGGRFEIGSVRLVDASVNLARGSAGQWNLALLLDRLPAGQAARRPPDLKLRAGRINFRDGLRKSTYFLNGVDLDLEAAAANELAWSYTASPARTDRSEQGFGIFSGTGRWRAGGAGPGVLEVELELEPSITSEVSTLLAGRDLGLEGRLASRARLHGPLSNVKLEGSISFEDLERSGLFTSTGKSWRLGYSGTLDFARQSFELRSEAPQGATLPFAVRVRLADFFGTPRWGVLFRFDSLPAATLVELGRRLGARVPAGLEAEGVLAGAAGFSSGSELQGMFEVRDGRLRFGASAPLGLEQAQISLAGDVITLRPAEIKPEQGEPVRVEGAWSGSSEALSLRLSGRALAIEDLAALEGRVPGAAPLPLLALCRGGKAAGTLEFRHEPQTTLPSRWSGQLTLSETSLAVEGFAEPLEISSALLRFNGGQWQLEKGRGAWGKLETAGSAQFNPQDRYPLHVSLETPAAGAAELEALLAPALGRPRGFLERTLRFGGAQPPGWLAGRRASAALRFGKLGVGPVVLHNVAGTAWWDGASVGIPSFTARWDEAALAGTLQVRLAAGGPHYRLLGQLSGQPFQRGRIDTEFELRATGAGAELLSSLRAEGRFDARNLEAGAETITQASGCWDLSVERRGPRLRLRCLDLLVDGAAHQGQAASNAEGKLSGEVSAGGRGWRISGALTPPQLVLTPAP
jgi:hypothetical protein